MKQFIEHNLLVLICIAILHDTYPQEKDSLIQLYPGMADTISYVDKAYFGLFNQVKGFENAVLFIRNNSQLLSRIKYSDNGITKDTTFVNNLSYLGSERARINTLLEEYEQMYSDPYEITALTRSGEKYSGILDAFSKDHVYLMIDENFLTGEEEEFKIKIPLSNINEVKVKAKTDYLTPILIGAGIGLAIGVSFPGAFGESDNSVSEPSEDLTETQKRIGGGIALGLSGAAIGWGIAYLSKEDDESIVFRSDQSVLRLKEYGRYYFRYNKSFEESYYEIH